MIFLPENAALSFSYNFGKDVAFLSLIAAIANIFIIIYINNIYITIIYLNNNIFEAPNKIIIYIYNNNIFIIDILFAFVQRGKR